MQQGCGKPGSPFIQAFSSFYIPDGTVEQLESLAEQQSVSTSAENAVRLRRAFDSFDISQYLSDVVAPTLVVHARNDAIHPLQQGRELATGINDAELVVLESRNHVMLPQEPTWQTFFDALRRHTAS
jgi:pimeloyl-ACP methyl ester carboxylesterase